MKKLITKLICSIAAVGAYMMLTVFPALAQDEIQINPDVLSRLQSTAPVEGGIYTITVSAGDLFTGLPAGGCTVTQLVDQMQKYRPSDWTILGNGSLDCFFQDSDGSLLFTFEHYGSYRYTGDTSGLSSAQKTNLERETGNQMVISPGSTSVTIDGYNMNGIISQILAVNAQHAQTNNASANTDYSTVLSISGWRLDAVGWWYDNGNGTWPANGWHWIDGNMDGVSECYYFDANGYILLNTITPDGYWVNGDGAWVQGDVVQVR